MVLIPLFIRSLQPLTLLSASRILTLLFSLVPNLVVLAWSVVIYSAPTLRFSKLRARLLTRSPRRLSRSVLSAIPQTPTHLLHRTLPQASPRRTLLLWLVLIRAVLKALLQNAKKYPLRISKISTFGVTTLLPSIPTLTTPQLVASLSDRSLMIMPTLREPSLRRSRREVLKLLALWASHLLPPLQTLLATTSTTGGTEPSQGATSAWQWPPTVTLTVCPKVLFTHSLASVQTVSGRWSMESLTTISLRIRWRRPPQSCSRKERWLSASDYLSKAFAVDNWVKLWSLKI